MLDFGGAVNILTMCLFWMGFLGCVTSVASSKL
jgi:hypothetical protein